MSSSDERPSFVDVKEFKELIEDIKKKRGALDDFFSQANRQPPDHIGQIEEVDVGEGVTRGAHAVQRKVNCRHYTDEDTSRLETTWMEIWSSKGAALCEHCRKEAPQVSTEGKQKGKKNKGAKGQGKDQSFWWCLDCGKIFCGGRDKVPQGHVRPHYRDNNHLWAARYEDPTVIYCFKCKKEVSLSFLDLKKLEKKPKGVKMTTTKVEKQLKDVLSPPDQISPCPPLHQTPSPSCSEGGSLQELGPSDTEVKLTPSPFMKTSTDTNVESHQMSGPPVSPPAVTSKSAADKVGSVIVKGLKNYGNTCFFNAVIQSLLALSSMRAIILRSDVQTGRLALLLRELFLMTQPSSGTENELNIWKLANVFLDKSQFARGKMHCSHECFVSFRQSLHEEEVKEWKNLKDKIDDHITISSFIFMGTRCTEITGVCNHSSSTESIPFCELLLPVPSKWTGDRDVVDGLVSLHDCLLSHFEQVTLPEWECTDCNSGRKEGAPISRKADQRSYIRRVPIVLTIGLVRVIGVDKKLYGHVSFPLVLDISEFMDPRFVGTSNTKYNLVAVVEHSGTANEGHYVSYTKPGSAWFKASDLTVEPVNDKQVLDCEAFLLFYERVGDTSPPPALLFKDDQWTYIVGKKKMKKTDVDGKKEMKKPMVPQLPLPSRQQKSVERAKIPSKVKKPCKNVGKSVPPAFSSSPNDDNTTYSGVTSKLQDKNTIELFKKFLNSNYLVFKGTLNSDCSFPFNVSYPEILKFSRHLAMMVCNHYNRLIKKLEEAAIEFIKGPNGYNAKVILRILQRPKRHESWQGYRTHVRLVKRMSVYGHTKSNLEHHSPRFIYKPLGEALLMLKGILCHIISNHKRGFSWGGNFDTKDVDVFNERIFLISKPPNKFKILAELIKAMAKDFLRYTELFLAELMNFMSNGDRVIPYLPNFYQILSSTEDFADYWLDEEKAERFRTLLVNHPFLKPSIIRSYLLSGIYAACRAHDMLDPNAEFKYVLRNGYSGTGSWITRINNLANIICTAVLKFDRRKFYEKKENDKDKSSGQVAEEADDDKDKEIYDDDLESFVEYMRHLFHHGPDNSKGKRNLIMDADGTYLSEDKPREQYMHSLEESEIGASLAVDGVVWELLLLLLVETNSMTGMLVDVWDAYKNYSSSSDPIGESETYEWLLMPDPIGESEADEWLLPDDGSHRN